MSKIVGYVLAGIVIVGLITAGVAVIYKTGQAHERTACNLEKSEAENEANQTKTGLEADLQEIKDEGQAELNKERLERAVLEEKLTKLKGLYNEKQSSDSDCNINRYVISLHNKASGYEIGDPENERLTADEKREASSITEQQFIEHARSCEFDYNELRIEFNNLIDQGLRVNAEVEKLK